MHAIAACGALGLFVVSVMAQTVDTSVKQTLEWILLFGAGLTILGNVAWSFFNRRHYDKLKETISELKEVIESKERRYQEYKASCEEEKAKWILSIAAVSSKNETLVVTNEALAGQNLQLKGQLTKQLRDQGDVDNE